MADAQLRLLVLALVARHLEQIQAYLRDPASTQLSDDVRTETIALALYGRSDQDDPPFDYFHVHALVAEGGYRDFERSPADVQRGLQKLGLDPNKKGGAGAR